MINIMMKLRSIPDYFSLMKPRINFLVLVTTFVGIWWASGPRTAPILYLWTLLGTGLAVGSANAFNHYWERESDARMDRTRDRPLPAGRLSPRQALIFGFVTGAIGLLVLWFTVNRLSALLALVAILSYVPLYTMMKPVTSLATIVGAIPGAIPPVIGWVAVTGTIEFPAVILFFVLFFWQPPHFIALALYLKDDYERAGLAMLPVELNERAACRQMTIYTFALLLMSYIPFMTELAGMIYFVVATVMGLIFLGLSLYVWLSRRQQSHDWARGLFLYSIIYLPVVLTVLVINRKGVMP